MIYYDVKSRDTTGMPDFELSVNPGNIVIISGIFFSLIFYFDLFSKRKKLV